MKKTFAILILLLTFVVVAAFGGCNKPQEPDPDDQLFVGAVSYKDFGAVGDGKTDDFAAIKATHEHANKNNLPVKADNATYYIAPHESIVTVKTSTDWGKAKFIVDDKSAREDSQEWWYPLFDVRPDTEGQTVTLPDGYNLHQGQNNVGLTFEKSQLLYIVNDGKKDFVRYGNNQDSGDNRQEIVLVDKDGNIDQTTPLLWDFDQVTKMTAYSVEEKAILLRGGHFTTVANDDSQVRHYFNRAIDIKRSNTVVKNVQHFVVDEGATGSPYNGFFRANFCTGVTFENCTMTGHKTYKNGNGVDQGTYDTRLNCCNNILYKNCTQSNDISDTKCWGIMCSDYCKNLVMNGCKLSRFDAHKGVYNATISNCTLGQNLSVCGGGTLLMENTVRISPQGSSGCNRFLTLRYDYGSFWKGDIILRNCTLRTYSGLNYVIDAGWYDWNFGYECCFPQTVTLDNVKIEYQTETSYTRSYVFGYITQTQGQTPQFMQQSNNPVVMTQKIIFKNKQTDFETTANTLGWFADTQTVVE